VGDLRLISSYAGFNPIVSQVHSGRALTPEFHYFCEVLTARALICRHCSRGFIRIEKEGLERARLPGSVQANDCPTGGGLGDLSA
jgi:hypothetical protein